MSLRALKLRRDLRASSGALPWRPRCVTCSSHSRGQTHTGRSEGDGQGPAAVPAEQQVHGDHAAAGSATKGSACPPPPTHTPGMLSGSWKLRHCTACVHLISRAGTDTALGRRRRRSSCPSVRPVQRSLCPLLAPGRLWFMLRVIWTPPSKKASGSLALACGWGGGGRAPGLGVGRWRCSARSGNPTVNSAQERLTQPRRVGLPVTTSLLRVPAACLSARRPQRCENDDLERNLPWD